jgi:hypothetical protein
MCEDIRNPLQKAIDILGPYKIAKLVNLRGPSIYKWRESGRLPRTEWTGETNYADTIAKACSERGDIDPPITRDQLLQRPVRTVGGSSTAADQVPA